MNINEMEKFTIAELSNFTIEELDLKANELLEQFRSDNRTIPISVFDKLEELCKAVPQANVKPEKTSKLKDALQIISHILTIAKNSIELSKIIRPHVIELIEFFVNLK